MSAGLTERSDVKSSARIYTQGAAQAATEYILMAPQRRIAGGGVADLKAGDASYLAGGELCLKQRLAGAEHQGK